MDYLPQNPAILVSSINMLLNQDSKIDAVNNRSECNEQEPGVESV